MNVIKNDKPHRLLAAGDGPVVICRCCGQSWAGPKPWSPIKPVFEEAARTQCKAR